MNHRRARLSGADQKSWPVFVLLLVAVVVPTACVLWFMTEAMRNERLATDQRLSKAYQSQLAVLRRQLDAFWAQRLTDLAARGAETDAPLLFARLVEQDLCDSAVIYDRAGQVVYPTPAPPIGDEDVGDSPEWAHAQRLEDEQQNPAAAAAAYALVAAHTADIDLAARARQAEARCLHKAGRTDAAIAALIGLVNDGRYRAARDPWGRLIAPDACLYALELMAEPICEGYGPVRDLLVARLADYAEPAMPSSQRRFLMRELRRVLRDCPRWPTLAAEDLAAAYVEASAAGGGTWPVFYLSVLAGVPQSGPGEQAAYLHPSRLAEVWETTAGDGRLVALYEQSRVVNQGRSLADSLVYSDEVEIRLVPPGAAVSKEPFLAGPAGEHLPGWRWALWLKGTDQWSQRADRRITVYLWAGLLVSMLILALAVLVARYVGRQMKLTRLKNDLIATVSHELKTPLASMRALVDTLIEGRYRDERQVGEYLGLIAKENTRLSRLIDNFLTFSRMERDKRAFELEAVRIEEVVAAAVDSVRERFESAGCRLDIDVAGDLPAITGDRDALVTVLLNLLDNAFKYSQDDKHIAIRAHNADGQIRLEVEDHGIGLSRRAMRRVFDRFYQVDRSLSRRAGGCGLGLSIVKFIVDAHRGTAGVKSEPGRGSTFTVTLPAMNDEG